MNTLEQFHSLVRSHDVTYFENKGEEYLTGMAQYEAIVEAGRLIDRAEAVRIWNENIDLISDDDAFRDNYYWRNFHA